MSTETERRLVAALNAGAAVIVDDRVASIDDIATPRTTPRPIRHRPSPWLVAAIAAIVLAIAVLTFVLRRDTKPQPANPFHSQACTVPVPSSWNSAIAAGTVASSTNLVPMAITPSGEVLAFAGSGPDDERIVLVHADSTITAVYTAPPSTGIGEGASTDGQWLAFQTTKRNSQQPRGITLVNLTTRERRVVRAPSTDSNLSLIGPVYADGKVYWNEAHQNNFGDGKLYAYDVATGTREVVATRVFRGPEGVLGAVVWQGSTKEEVRGNLTLPAGLTLDEIDTDTSRDGSTLVWHVVTTTATAGVYAVDANGKNRTRVYRQTKDEAIKITGLAGQFVVVANVQGLPVRIVDTRTGASIVLHDGTSSVIQDSRSMAGGGTIAFARAAPHTKTKLVILHAATLPDLRC